MVEGSWSNMEKMTLKRKSSEDWKPMKKNLVHQKCYIKLYSLIQIWIFLSKQYRRLFCILILNSKWVYLCSLCKQKIKLIRSSMVSFHRLTYIDMNRSWTTKMFIIKPLIIFILNSSEIDNNIIKRLRTNILKYLYSWILLYFM